MDGDACASAFDEKLEASSRSMGMRTGRSLSNWNEVSKSLQGTVRRLPRRGPRASRRRRVGIRDAPVSQKEKVHDRASPIQTGGPGACIRGRARVRHGRQGPHCRKTYGNRTVPCSRLLLLLRLSSRRLSCTKKEVVARGLAPLALAQAELRDTNQLDLAPTSSWAAGGVTAVRRRRRARRL